MSSTALAHVSQSLQGMVAPADFMPVFDMQLAIQRRNLMVEFTKQIMVEGTDYGTIPGSPKPCLLKAGAEKLCTFFGLVSEFVLAECVEDWTGNDHNGESFFYYRYRCRLLRSGRLLGEGEGSCNTWESKYRYRWVDAVHVAVNGLDPDKLVKRGGSISEFEFAVDKAETSGKYGKPAEYWQAFKDAIQNGTARKVQKKIKNGEERPAWEIDSTQYRVANPDVADQVNTCQKMAQKRALVAATLISVNASEYFTQDIEDLQTIDIPYEVIDPGPSRNTTNTKTDGGVQHAPTGAGRDAKPAGSGTSVKSPTPPAAASGARSADELKKTLETLRAEYEMHGQAAFYTRILEMHAGAPGQQPKTLKSARECVAEMEDILVRIKEEAAQEVA